VLYREPKLLKPENKKPPRTALVRISVLYREPKLLKPPPNSITNSRPLSISVLYREPKLLKHRVLDVVCKWGLDFSALP
jgi:hypothetical protein